MSRPDLPIHDAVETIEAALVKAFRSSSVHAHIYCDRGTWFADWSDEDGWSRDTINLSQIARDMERELSC